MNSKIVLIALIALTVLIAGCIDKDTNPLKNNGTEDQGMSKYFVYDKEIKPCTTSSLSQPENLKTFEDQFKEISFKYPDNWEYRTTYGGAKFIVGKGKALNAVFLAGNTASASLFKSDNKLQAIETNLQTETAFRINKRLKRDSAVEDKDFIEICSTTLDNNPATKLVYNGYLGIDAEKADEIEAIKRMEVLTVKNGRTYIVEFELTERKGENLFEEYLPEVNYVISTLKINTLKTE